jgi:hypothetical protein
LLASIGNRQLVEPTAVRVEEEAQIVAEVSLAWTRLRASVDHTEARKTIAYPAGEAGEWMIPPDQGDPRVR